MARRLTRVRIFLPIVAALAALFVIHTIRPASPPTAGVFDREPAVRAHLHHTFAGYAQEPRQIAFSPDARTLAVSCVDGTVKLWRLSDLSLERTLTHPAGVTSIAFSPNGQWLVSGSYDGVVRLWGMVNGALVRTLVGHKGTVWSVAVSPDGESIASSGEDTTVRLWRLDDGAPLRTLSGHALNVWKVAFSPDGRRLASGSFDHTVRVWDVGTGLPTRIVTGHTQAVVSLAFSPDGGWLASGGDDSTIILNRPHPQAPVRVLAGSAHVYSVDFSPDGRWLASGGRERGAVGTFWKQLTGNRMRRSNGVTVRLWRVEDGAPQQALAEHTDDVWSVAFSPDGRWLASASEDKTVKLYRLETTEKR